MGNLVSLWQYILPRLGGGSVGSSGKMVVSCIPDPFALLKQVVDKWNFWGFSQGLEADWCLGDQCPQMNVWIPWSWLSGCGFGNRIIERLMDRAGNEVRRDDRLWMFWCFFGSVETWQFICLDFLGPWMARNYEFKMSVKDSPSGMFWGWDFWLHIEIPDFCDLWVQQRYDIVLLDNVSNLLEPASWRASHNYRCQISL